MATRAQTRKRKSPDQEGDTEHRDNPTSSKRIKRTEKATDSIPWEVFYMSVAALEAQRSNCLDDKKVRRYWCSYVLPSSAEYWCMQKGFSLVDAQ